jgi:hypothetical protein
MRVSLKWVVQSEQIRSRARGGEGNKWGVYARVVVDPLFKRCKRTKLVVACLFAIDIELVVPKSDARHCRPDNLCPSWQGKGLPGQERVPGRCGLNPRGGEVGWGGRERSIGGPWRHCPSRIRVPHGPRIHRISGECRSKVHVL